MPVATGREAVPATISFDYVGYIYGNDYGSYVALVPSQDGQCICYARDATSCRSRSKLVLVFNGLCSC